VTTTVAAQQLPKLSTTDLIAQYDLAMSARTRVISADGNDISRTQKRINRIVDILSARADADDAEALAWYAN